MTAAKTSHKQIFVNLPVKNIPATKQFFTGLGFDFNPQFSNDKGICMIVAENIFVMLLDVEFYKTFTKKPIADAFKSNEVLVCLSCDSRAHVDDLVTKAIAAGGTAPNAPRDHGFMYGHGFDDLDGHTWELAYMDMSALPADMSGGASA
ncbi:VOC family protein [soil metagenome]